MYKYASRGDYAGCAVSAFNQMNKVLKGENVKGPMRVISNALLASPYRAELEKVLGPVYFRYREVESKAMSPEIVEDMIEENKLCSEYSKLMAGLEFQFRGETYSRAALAGFFKDDDRETRKEAYEVFGKKMLEVAPQLDDIYDRMVKVRDRMAKKLGYKNFVELGYYRMNRVSYGQKEVETFRKNVLESWVPANSRLRLENAKELGLDAIHDTVHEMARDEARHGRAFQGLLERYFGK